MAEKKYTYTEFQEKFFPNYKEAMNRLKDETYNPETFVSWEKIIPTAEVREIQTWLILSNYLPLTMRRKLHSLLAEVIVLRSIK